MGKDIKVAVMSVIAVTILSISVSSLAQPSRPADIHL